MVEGRELLQAQCPDKAGAGAQRAWCHDRERVTNQVSSSGLLRRRGEVDPTEGALGCEYVVPKQAARRTVLVCRGSGDPHPAVPVRGCAVGRVGIGRPCAASVGDRGHQIWWQSVRRPQSWTQGVGGTGVSPRSRRLHTVKLSRQKTASSEGEVWGANPLLAPRKPTDSEYGRAFSGARGYTSAEDVDDVGCRIPLCTSGTPYRGRLGDRKSVV